MKKGLFGLNGFASVVVFIVALALISAIVVFSTVGSVITVDPAQAPAEAAVSDYQHGSNINRSGQTSGTAVNSGTNFVSYINSNTSMYLTADFSVDASSFGNTSTYSGTIYGNGHTVTLNVPTEVEGYSSTAQNCAGGIIGILTGKLYDCKFVLQGGQYISGLRTSSADPYFGGLIGNVQGGTVDNVSIEVKSGVSLANYAWASGKYSALGILAGHGDSAKITNVTVVNNGGEFKSGYATNTSVNWDNISTGNTLSSTANLVGYYNGTSQTVDNIIIGGSGSTLYGKYVSNLGLSSSVNTRITTTNFYNSFLGTLSGDNNGVNVTYVKHIDSGTFGGTSYVGSVSVTNYFEYYNSDSDMVKVPTNSGEQVSNRSITEKLSVQTTATAEATGRQILFNPAATDYANSLVLAYTGRDTSMPSSVRTWKVRTYSRASYTGTVSDGAVIFTNLPVSSVWNDKRWGTGSYSGGDGIFTSTLSYTDDFSSFKVADLKEYEHGYVSGNSPSETGLNNSTFFDKFVNRESTTAHNGSGNYYLTEDVYITGFTGRDFGGTLDGNGKTIYIYGAQSSLTGQYIGGLVGTLTGTIKNVRIVICADVTLASTNTGNRGFGLVAGRVNGGTVENVSVVVKSGVSVQTEDVSMTTSLGGICGTMETKANVSNVTLQLDGTLSCIGSYAFLGGISGRIEKPTSENAYKLTNIIIKGSGKFGGNAKNGSEYKNVAAVGVMLGTTGTSQVNLDGLIYNLTATANSTYRTPVEGNYAAYGYFTQNNYNGATEQGAANYVTCSNVFEVDGAKMNQHKYPGSAGTGNTWIAIAETASISTAVDGLSGSSVTPYFRPFSDTDITLVASASNWGDYKVIKARGDSTDFSVNKNNDKVVDVPKAEAVDGSSIVLVKLETVSDPVISGSYAYTGDVLTYAVTLNYKDQQLGSENYTINVADGAEVKNAGEYTLEITLLNGYYFYDSASDTPSATASLKFTVQRASVYLTIKLNNPSVTYNGGGQSGDPYVSATGNDAISIEELGEVTYTFDDQTSLPVNAGTYSVKAAIANSDNVEISEVIPASLTIKPADITLGVFDVEKAFTEIDDSNKNLNDTYGDLNLTGFVDENNGYTLSIQDNAADYISDNGGNSYLPAGEYTVTVLLNSSNYGFAGGNDTFTLTVTKNESANSWVTEFARAGWTYYSEPTTPTDAAARFGTPEVKYYSDSQKLTEVYEFNNETDAGTYYYIVTVAGTDSYNALTVEGQFEVTKLSVTVSLSAEKAVYTADPYAGTITVTVTGTDDSTYPSEILGEITYSIDGKTVINGELPANADTYTLGIASITNSKNLEANFSATTELIIEPKPVSFTAELNEGASLIYGQEAPDFKTLVSVTHETLQDFDFVEEDWNYTATSDYTESTTVGADVSIFVTVEITDPNYTVQAGCESFTLKIEVTKATIKLEVSVDGGEYTGKAKEAEVTGQPEGVTPTVTYYSVNEAETGDARYTQLDSAPVNAGKYAVKATVTGLNDYEDADSGWVEYTIAKATVSFSVSIAGWTYGEDAKAPVINDLSHEYLGEYITYLYSGDGAYSSDVAPESAGTYTVKASYPGDDNHNAYSVTSSQFVVAKAELKDLAVAVESWVYDGNSHTVVPSVTGNLENGSETFKYYSGDTSVANGEIKHAGIYKVVAEIGASANYNAKTVESTFEVTAKEVTLAISQYSFKFGVLTPSNRLNATNYGSVIGGIFDGDNDVYSFSMYIDETEDVSETYLKVKEGGYTLVVTLKNADYVFDDGSMSKNVSVTVEKTTNEVTGAYSRADWTYYDPISAETKPSFKFGNTNVQTKYYLDEERKNEYTETFGIATPADTYYVLMFVPETENYGYVEATGQFEVLKREVNVTVSAEKTEFEYGDEIEGLSNSFDNLGSYGNVVLGVTGYRYKAEGEESWTDGLPQNVNVGAYVIEFTYTNTANVALSADSVDSLTLTVVEKPVTFTVSVEDGAVYGMSLAEVEALVNIDTTTELEYGKTITVKAGDADYDQYVAAGVEISIAVSISVTDTNYIASVTGDQTKTLVVQKAPLTVTAKDKSILRAEIYDYQDLSSIYDCFTVEGLKNEHTFATLFELTSAPDDFGIFSVDSYTVTASLKSDEPLTSNYEIASGSDTEMLFTLSIDKYTMSVSIKGWTYGDESNNPVPEGYPLVLGQNMQFRYTGTTASGMGYDSSEAPSEAGEYTLTVTIPATEEYTAGEASCDFVVAARAIDVTSSETRLSRVFDADNGTYASAFYRYLSVTNAVYDDTVESIFEVVLKNAAGEEITSIYSAGEYGVSLKLVNANYTLAGETPEIAYVVDKADMTVTIKIDGWTYNDPSPDPVVEGVMENAAYSFTYTGVTNSGEEYSSESKPVNAGTYTVTVNVSATANYNGTSAESKEFVVARASFETSVQISDRIYGETAQSPSVSENPGNGEVTFVYYSADGSVDYGSKAPVNAGEYKVVATVTETHNYESATAEASFTIEKAEIAPAIASVSASVYSGAAVTATLTEASNPGNAEVEFIFERLSGEEWNAAAQAIYAGSYRVKAVIGESDNYFGGETAYYTFGITAKEITYTWSLTDDRIIYGDSSEVVLGSIVYDEEGILNDFAESDREFVRFVLGAVSLGADYSPAVNAGSTVTFSLAVSLDENAGKDVIDSYVIKLSAPAVDSKEVAVKTISIDSTDSYDVYGDSYTEGVSLGEYFGGYFTYNGESVNALDDGTNTVEYSVGSVSATLPNAGSYIVSVSVSGNYSGYAELTYVIEKAEIALNPGYEFAFGYLNADNIADKEVYDLLITGLVEGESVDYVLSVETGDEDMYAGYLKVNTYTIAVSVPESVNYTFAGGAYVDSFEVEVVKSINEWISEFSRNDWTYLSDPAEAVMPEARFDTEYVSVKYYSDPEYANELSEADFASGIPAGIYYAVAYVAGTDHFEELIGEYTFEVLKLNAVVSVSTPDAEFDGAPYDGIGYTVSGADASLIGEISWKYSVNGVSFTDGLPTDAGSYVVRIAGIDNDSVTITNIDEDFGLVIAPKSVQFKVKLKSGVTVVFGDEISDAADFVDSVTPASDEVGRFTYTAKVVDSYGREYKPGMSAGSLLSVVVSVDIDDGNYVATVFSSPTITIAQREIEPEVVLEEEVLTDGDSVSVLEGKAYTFIDAIKSYLSENEVAYYEYDIYVDGVKYSSERAAALAPGEHKVAVNLTGNYSGSFNFNMLVEEDPDAVAVSVREPLTPVGEFLNTINLNMAGALAIVFAFVISLVVIVFFGLRRRKK